MDLSSGCLNNVTKFYLSEFEIYGNMSDLKVSIENTRLVWIGKKHYSKDKLVVGVGVVILLL